MGEMPLELHAELGQRTAGDHRHPAEDAGGDQARRHHQGRDRSGAEVLHVGARRPGQPGRLGHRLGHVAAAALVAVADGLLAAAEHELDRRRVDAVAVEEVDQRQRGRRLAAQVLEDDGGGEGVVVVVAVRTAADVRPRPSPAGGPMARAPGSAATASASPRCWSIPVEVDPLGQRMAGQARPRRRRAAAGASVTRSKAIDGGQQPEKLGFGHDLAGGAEAEVGRPVAVPPGRRRHRRVHGRAGRARGWHGADVGLVRRIGDRRR